MKTVMLQDSHITIFFLEKKSHNITTTKILLKSQIQFWGKVAMLAQTKVIIVSKRVLTLQIKSQNTEKEVVMLWQICDGGKSCNILEVKNSLNVTWKYKSLRTIFSPNSGPNNPSWRSFNAGISNNCNCEPKFLIECNLHHIKHKKDSSHLV